jgi:hypothetical protein
MMLLLPRVLARPLALAGLACVMAAPLAARAGVPSPENCTWPTHVVLVGHGPAGVAGADSTFGQLVMVVRDVGRNPVPNAHVVLEFTDYAEFRIASDQLDPRLAVDCASRSITTLTDGYGVARITVIGGGRSPAGPARENQAASIRIADMPYYGSRPLPCSALDMNGVSGVDGADLSRWGADLFTGLDPTRADFDADGRVTGLDLSLWSIAFFSGGSAYSASDYCP